MRGRKQRAARSRDDRTEDAVRRSREEQRHDGRQQVRAHELGAVDVSVIEEQQRHEAHQLQACHSDWATGLELQRTTDGRSVVEARGDDCRSFTRELGVVLEAADQDGDEAQRLVALGGVGELESRGNDGAHARRVVEQRT